jgi:hypothetical protein
VRWHRLVLADRCPAAGFPEAGHRCDALVLAATQP